MNSHAWRTRLNEYVDGEIPERDLGQIEEHLRSCPQCASEALTRMQLKQATRAAASMRFAAPADLRRRIELSIAASRPSRVAFWSRPAVAIAMAACLVLVLGFSAVLLRQRQASPEAMAQLLDLHVGALASPNPVDVASSDRHTVKPWFQGKLPYTFNLPELTASPFKLNGGKLVYVHGQPSAQLIYILRQHEFSVFITQEGAVDGVSDARKNGFSTESWASAGLRYVVISDAGTADVHALGDLLRTVQ
jgi:anti-sigma factor RsiW